jgi:hypothetical protein
MATSIETWTAPRDFRLRLMRQEGATWEEIAAALTVAAEAAMTRAERIGACRPPLGPARREDPTREPLPTGDPLAWGVLTQGTWLAGTRYPAPLSAGGAV